MRIVTFLLAALVIAAVGAAAFYYFTTFQPMLTDYTRMKAGMPEMDRAKTELKKYKERDARETGWIKPALDELNAGLSDEIKAGKAEVAATSSGIVINIAEDVMYTPKSMTFAKSSPQLRLKIAALLAGNAVKGREIIVGNTTDPAPAQGKGRNRIPPRDARSLAADRSVALAKYLEQNKVDPERLVAVAYGAKLPDTGFKIKSHKTIIIIENEPAPSAVHVPAQPKPAPAQPAQPKTIPLKPAQPKGQ